MRRLFYLRGEDEEEKLAPYTFVEGLREQGIDAKMEPNAYWLLFTLKIRAKLEKPSKAHILSEKA